MSTGPVSSEALERLRTNARVHHTNGDVTLTALASDVDALLAALAEARECAEKAERERDEALSVREGLISPVQKVLQLRDALAVARKREQRAHVGYLREIDAIAERYERQHERQQAATELLREFYELQQSPRSAVHADGPLVDKIDAALAALDAPAAATLAEPGAEADKGASASAVSGSVRTPPGSASAAADEPLKVRTAEESAGKRNLRVAADEPGETP